MNAKAYVQGDWVASDRAHTTDAVTIPSLKESYEKFLALLARHGIQNVATWHIEAVGAYGKEGKSKDADVLRNFAQIAEADCVISRLVQSDPPFKHWGSLALMAHAMALGKKCYVIAADDCVVWKSHIMHHPLIVQCADEEELLKYF